MTATAPNPTATGRGHLTAFSAALASMTLVGAATPVLALLGDYPAFAGQAIRFALGGLILTALIPLTADRSRREPVEPGDWVKLAAIGLTGVALFNVFLLQALEHSDPSAVGTVIGGVPVALAVVSPLLAGRRPSPRILAAAGVVTAGIAVTEGLGGGTWAGLAWGAAALTVEVASHLIAAAVVPKLGAVRVAAMVSLAAVPMLAGAAFVEDGANAFPAPTGAEWLALAYLGVLGTAVAFTLWFTSLPVIGVERAGLCAGAAPVAAVAASWLLGTEPPHPAGALGAVLVAAGLAIGMWRRRRGPETIRMDA
ncbi:DMT family transporter [Salininema proteolyticum]|uniref:DMT family transporter n=1 Tax=Salininema proteolyticum TaxID=1607685 RepID=A0ABV8TVD2_9ACTN